MVEMGAVNPTYNLKPPCLFALRVNNVCFLFDVATFPSALSLACIKWASPDQKTKEGS